MELTGYLRILRQRWWLVALPCVAAVMVAALTLPDEAEATGPTVTSFQATATLITSPVAFGDAMPVNLSTVALYATIGEIPEGAAEIMGYEGEPQLLASLVSVTPSPDTATLTISSSDPDGATAALRVNAFADATVAYFHDQQIQQVRDRIRAVRRQLSSTSAQLEKLRARQVVDGDAVINAKIAALQEQYTGHFSELSGLTQSAGNVDLLTVLEPGFPIPQTTQSFAAPSSPLARVGIAGMLGLVLGAALALVVERLDSRMRTREQVEEAMGLPVLAEIPVLPRHHRQGVVSAELPASVVAEAFRGLRSAVLLMSPGRAARAARQGQKRASLAVLVTSALPGEGKTTTVANLAAVMAEAGRRVLVLSLDLRNPRLHQCFDMNNGTGLSDLLAANRGRELREVVRTTGIPGVGIATSGHNLDHPGALLASAGPMIAAAKALADVVLIDTPPMLAVSDALDLARHADATLLVTRLNKATRSEADECQRLFSRLGVAALGTVLVGSRSAGAWYGYSLVGRKESRAPSERVNDAMTEAN